MPACGIDAETLRRLLPRQHITATIGVRVRSGQPTLSATLAEGSLERYAPHVPSLMNRHIGHLMMKPLAITIAVSVVLLVLVAALWNFRVFARGVHNRPLAGADAMLAALWTMLRAGRAPQKTSKRHVKESG